MKRKLFLLLCALLTMIGVTQVKAQASFNHTYTEGATVAAGEGYFLYNIGAGQFLTAGLNYGTRATVDNSGRVLTLAVNGTGYSIYTNYVSLNNRTDAKAGYLTTNGYVDTGNNDAAWVFTPVNLAGYTNAYTIKNSDTQFLFFDKDNTDPGCPVNVGNNPGNNYSLWLLIPKSAREAAGDYSHYLINTQMNSAWEFKTWGGSTGWNDNSVYTPGGLVSNRCGEKYRATTDVYQQIKETLPNGRYRINAQGFWRQDGSDAGAYLYANDDKAVLAGLNAHGEGTAETMNGASTSFSAGLYINSVETFVSNGSLRTGIKVESSSQWVIFDNFVLDYLGQCVMDYAEALPDGGAMEANKWYYFDIAVAGDYNATATTLGDIICTSDAYAQINAASGNVTLQAEENAFVAGRYYVKSSSANNLSIDVATYSYIVSQGAADVAYTQPGKTVTVSFTTSTNDPSATLAQDYSGVTFNGSSVVCTPTASGFTFEVPEGLAGATAYTLAIPAGAIGYNAGSTYNEAQNITLTTPAIFDGEYYLYNPFTKTFLGRGNAYGTAAVGDKYGTPFILTTDKENKSTIKFKDNNLNLFNTYWLFADGNNPDKFQITASTVGDCSGYAFYNQNLAENNRMYVAVRNDGDNLRVAGNAIVGDNCPDERQTVWQVKTAAEHAAMVGAYPTDNINNVIAAAGISTTAAEFKTYLAANYDAIDVTSVIGTATFGNNSGDWTWTVVRNENDQPQYSDGYARIWQATGSFTQTIPSASLPAGIYKIKMAAFDRRAAATTDIALDESVSSSYLNANGEQLRIKSWLETMHDVKGYDGNETWAQQAEALSDGTCDGELYIYLDGSTDLTLTVAKPNYCSQSYMCFGGFELTRYTDPIVIPTALTLNETALSFNADNYSATLTATPTPAEAAPEVTWSSSDESVATVTAAGVVTGVSTGTATITATSLYDTNVKATCEVTVSFTEYTGYTKTFEKDGVKYFLAEKNLVKNGNFAYPTPEYGYTGGDGKPIVVPANWTIVEDNGDNYLKSNGENTGAGDAKSFSTHWAIESGKKYVFGYTAKKDGAEQNTEYIKTSLSTSGNYSEDKVLSGTGTEADPYVAIGTEWKEMSYLVDNTEGTYSYVQLRARWIGSNKLSLDKFYLAEVVGQESATDDTKTVDGEVTEDYIVTPSATTPIVDISGATFDGDLTANFSSNDNGFIIATAEQKVALGDIKNVVVGNTCDKLVLTDGVKAVIPAALTQATSATYSRTIAPASNYGTICLPYAVESNDGIQYYTVEQIVGNVLKLTKVASVDAGTPAIFKKKNGEATQITASNTNAAVTSDAGEQGESVTLKGAFVQTVVGDINSTSGTALTGKYYIKNNQFCQGVDYFTVNPFRAYLETGSGNNARLTLQIDDEATAISELKTLDEKLGLKDGKYLIGGKIIVVKEGQQFNVNGVIYK